MARTAIATLLLVALPGCALTGSRGPLADRVLPCPCDLDGLAQLSAERPRVVIKRDSDRATARYHPGAFVCYRVFDPDADAIAGNQCAYDADGRLITDGPAAGTPDFISPDRSVFGHWLVDVRPFRRLGWMAYHEQGWAPVSAPYCE